MGPVLSRSAWISVLTCGLAIFDSRVSFLFSGSVRLLLVHMVCPLGQLSVSAENLYILL